MNIPSTQICGTTILGILMAVLIIVICASRFGLSLTNAGDKSALSDLGWLAPRDKEDELTG